MALPQRPEYRKIPPCIGHDISAVEQATRYNAVISEVMSYIEYIESDNARLNAIFEGLPSVGEIREIVYGISLLHEDTETIPLALFIDQADAIHARLHNPTIRKSLTVDNAPAEQDKGDQKQ